MFDSYKQEDNLISRLDNEYILDLFCKKHNIKCNDFDNLENKIKLVIKTPDLFYNNINEFNIDKITFINFAMSISIKIFNKRLIDFIRKNYF